MSSSEANFEWFHSGPDKRWSGRMQEGIDDRGSYFFVAVVQPDGSFVGKVVAGYELTSWTFYPDEVAWQEALPAVQAAWGADPEQGQRWQRMEEFLQELSVAQEDTELAANRVLSAWRNWNETHSS